MDAIRGTGNKTTPPDLVRGALRITALTAALAAATVAAGTAAVDSAWTGNGLMLAASRAIDSADALPGPVNGYWVSEKLDGVRGRWDGRRLWTRGGLPVDAPAWFTAGWPPIPMDGELWLGRGRFEQASSLVRNPPADDAPWRDMRFMVFDLPAHGGRFDERVEAMRALAGPGVPSWLRPVVQSRVADTARLQARLSAVLAAGGEGLMLHHGDGAYGAGRSPALLKLKPHDDDQARVIAHLPGQGRYAGMLGALLVEREDGVRFRLGSGLSDRDRGDPPPRGSVVIYRHSGVTANGLPRFPRYLRRQAPPVDAIARPAEP